MAKVGILACESVTNEMNCVMIGCLGNLRGRQGLFKQYPEGEQVDLLGIIHCGGCPTGVGTDRIWQKVQALVDYGIDSLHLSSCLVELCPFKGAFLDVIRKEYPDLKVVEGTHFYDDVEAFKSGVRELLSQRVVTPQRMNDVVFKRVKLPPDEDGG